jgi:hypothetical protein
MSAAARWIAVHLAKLAIVFLMIAPVSLILEMLSKPTYAHFLSFFIAAFLTSVIILKVADKQKKDKGFKMLVGLWVLFVGSLVLYYTGIANDRIFVRIIGFFGVLVAELFLLLSVFVGKRRFKALEEVLFTTALLFPLIGSVLSVLTLGDLYKSGILLSLICSLMNIMFNKSGYSIGVPELLRTPSSTELNLLSNSYIIQKPAISKMGKVGVVDPKKRTVRRRADDPLKNRSVSSASDTSTT